MPKLTDEFLDDGLFEDEIDRTFMHDIVEKANISIKRVSSNRAELKLFECDPNEVDGVFSSSTKTPFYYTLELVMKITRSRAVKTLNARLCYIKYFTNDTAELAFGIEIDYPKGQITSIDTVETIRTQDDFKAVLKRVLNSTSTRRQIVRAKKGIALY